MIEEILITKIAPAIAKSILRLWVVGDEAWGESVTSGLIDLLSEKVTDKFVLARAENRFGEMGVRIAENAYSLFQYEQYNLSNESKESIALTLETMLIATPLNAKLLVDIDYKPMALKSCIMESNKLLLIGYSGDEKLFLNNVLFYVCEHLIQLATKLPEVSFATLTEVLRLDRAISQKTDLILAELRNLRINSELGNKASAAAQFELAYRSIIIHNLDSIELLGLNFTKANREYLLSVAYIPLSVELTSNEDNTIPQGMVDAEAATLLRVDDVLKTKKRLLLMGVAGSGKTTLLRWIAVNWARKSFTPDLQELNNCVPFIVTLRNFSDTSLPKPNSFPFLISPVLGDLPPAIKDWVEEKLIQGNAIVMVDGLDEVPERQRPTVKKWVRSLVNGYPAARFLVTTRPAAIEHGWLQGEDFEEVQLREMQLTDINKFLYHWHSAAKVSKNYGINDYLAKRMAEDLFRMIQERRPLRSLCENPLLCAMTCALHIHYKQHLPKNRVEVYNIGCEMLMERRDKFRDINLSVDYPQLGARQKKAILKYLAYYMMRNGQTVIRLERASEVVGKKLLQLQDTPPEATGESVLRLFLHRDGILREPQVGFIEFTHRTFQEFFAAQEVVDEMDEDFLLDHAHIDLWQEVIVLAVGVANSNIIASKIVSGLIEKGDKDEKNRSRLYLLAVTCLETLLTKNSEIESAISARLATLIPPRDLSAARALAIAGDLAVPHLVASDVTLADTQATVHSIHSLGYIGSVYAMNALETYVAHSNQSVADAFLEVWDKFSNRSEFSRRVLAPSLAFRETISLTDLPSLEGIQFITNVKRLNLSKSEFIADLRLLRHLQLLESLNLSYCSRIKDLSPLAELGKLKSIKISYCRNITDISPLVNCLELESISMVGCSGISNLTILLRVPKLKELIISRDASMLFEQFKERGVNVVQVVDEEGQTEYE